jgi:hypothetical protein
MRRLTNWLNPSKTRSANARKHRARLALSPLESREVMSAVLSNGVLTVTGDDPGIGDADTIEILSPTAGQMVVRVNGQQQFSGSNAISRVEIDGRAGVDTVFIRGVQSGIADGVRVRNTEIVNFGDPVPGTGLQSMANVRSSVFVDRAAFLNLRDTASSADRTVVVSGQAVTGLSPAPISYTLGPEAIMIIRSGRGVDMFQVEGTSQALTRLFGGAGGDTFDIERWNGGVEVIGETGADAVTIGSPGVTFGQNPGRVRVTDGSFQDSVTVLHDEVAANATFFPSYQATLTPDMLDVRVVASNLAGNLLVPLGFNQTIVLDDVGAVDYRAPARQATTTSLIDIRAVDRFTEVRMDVGGTALTRLGSTAGTLNGIIGRTTMTGGLPGNRLVLNDSGLTVARTYGVNAGSVTFPDPTFGQRSINFANYLGEVQLQAGSAGDRFNVNGLRADGRQMTVDGNGGTDTIVAPNQANSWLLTGPNRGVLNAQVNYVDTNNLTGRTQDDHFRFLPGGAVGGRIDGGGGFDTLDYSLFTTTVTSNLTTGASTAVGNGVANIVNVFGGSAGDTLTGNGLSNVLIGNQGNDQIDGTAGGRDILIGGTGADTLRKTIGGDDTIYVGGDVAPADQNNVASMKAIMTTWLRADTFDFRLELLAAGVGPGGSVRLSSEALGGDGATDTFIGTFGREAFFREAVDSFSGNFLPGPADRVITV